jgi:hypothetical protein
VPPPCIRSGGALEDRQTLWPLAPLAGKQRTAAATLELELVHRAAYPADRYCVCRFPSLAWPGCYGCFLAVVRQLGLCSHMNTLMHSAAPGRLAGKWAATVVLGTGHCPVAGMYGEDLQALPEHLRKERSSTMHLPTGLHGQQR